MQLLTPLLGGAGFAIAAAAAYFHLRWRARPAPTILLIAAAFALLLNAAHLGSSISSLGAVETFRQSYSSALLLATCIGLAGFFTHMARGLRGLDGFLFISATIVQFGALAVIREPASEPGYKAWFVSHSLAFILSGTFFVAGGTAGVAYLLISRLLRRKRASTLVGSVAPLESLDRFGRWMLMIGFPLFTYGLLTGICEVVRSVDPQAWLLDGAIIFSFFAWAAYAVLVVSMWVRPDIRGRRAATLATCSLGLIALVFLMIEFSPLHR